MRFIRYPLFPELLKHRTDALFAFRSLAVAVRLFSNLRLVAIGGRALLSCRSS